VSFGLQPSLWSLPLDTEAIGEDHRSFGSLTHSARSSLGAGAWVDVQRGWMPNGFGLLDSLLSMADWQAERRPMYDRIVDVPRLLRVYPSAETVPFPALVEARTLLSAHYRRELGEDFASTSMCLYRDGQDSVAWHGDTIGRGATHDTIVAILSLGASRTLALRPRGGGTSRRFVLDHGDLIVMGGSCQRTWEHAIPKTARRVGPRVSIQFRAAGVG
jgi:alkylated DNA repair dioxygenase AlkB